MVRDINNIQNLVLHIHDDVCSHECHPNFLVRCAYSRQRDFNLCFLTLRTVLVDNLANTFDGQRMHSFLEQHLAYT